MVRMSSFPSSGVNDILEALQNYVTMRQYNQSTRHSVFNLLTAIIGQFKSYILETIPELFIKTFIHITSGEKDPRNLMISFELSRDILSMADDLSASAKRGPVDTKSEKIVETYRSILRTHATELFDVTFCYFPITFEPPKNDPYGITSLDLKLALRNSLSANGVFSTEIFPALMDKMAASALKVKNEALATIVACIEKYDPSDVAPLWKDIWDGLKYEVLHGSDETVGGVISTQELTLDALRALARSLLRLQKEVALNPVQIVDNDTEQKKDPFEQYTHTIITETVDVICDTTNKKSIPNAVLVSGIAGASLSIYELLSAATLGKVLSKNGSSSGGITITAQKHLLKITRAFIEASNTIGPDVTIEGTGERFAHKIKETRETLAINALAPFKDQLINLFTKSLMGVPRTEHELRNLAVDNISSLICIQEPDSQGTAKTSINELLDDEELGLLLQYLDDALLLESTDESGAGGDKKGRIELAENILKTLVKITERRQEVVLTVSYPFFISKLPDSDTATADQSSESKEVLIGTVLRALSQMASVSRSVFEVLYVRLLSKLDVILTSSSPKYTLAIFSTLAAVLRQLLNANPNDEQKTSEEGDQSQIRSREAIEQDAIIFSKKLLPLIFTKFITLTSATQSPLSNIHVIVSASMCLMYIAQALPADSQKELAENLFSIFWPSPSSSSPNASSKILTKGVSLPTAFSPFGFEQLKFSPLAVLFLYSIAPITVSSGTKDFAVTYNLVGLVKAISQTLITSSRRVKLESDEESKPLRLTYLRIISILLNKWVKSNEIKPFIEDLKSAISSHNGIDNAKSDRLASLELLVWVVKAYLIRNDSLAFDILPFLLGLLNSEDVSVGNSTAKLMELLVAEDGLISGPPQSGCVVRRIYKQRFFVAVLEPLISGFEGSSGNGGNRETGMPSSKVNHLVALAGILRWMPSSIITPHISRFFKLLLQSLTVNDGRVREASINTITAVILNSTSQDASTSTKAIKIKKEAEELGVSVNSLGIASASLTPESSILKKSASGVQDDISPPEYISEHLTSLVPALLVTCLPASTESHQTILAPSVRIAALRCLNSFVDNIPINRLQPHSRTVIRELGKVVDDKRRSVRKEAVRTRQKYYEMNIQDLDDE